MFMQCVDINQSMCDINPSLSFKTRVSIVLLCKGWESSLQAGTAEEGDEEIQA